MPSRKSNSSETHAESRRSSLRRLSSIASFQNLFTRRVRATNAPDATAASSSSNLSLSVTSSSLAEPSPKPATTDETQQGEDDMVTAWPTAQGERSRRSSYVCLPDDPIGGMPRSRTVSNIPVLKSSGLAASKSHARLPAAFSSSTRLPSPPMSTRMHSHSRLTSVESKVPVVRSRMKRSDTEPLLPMAGGNGVAVGRSTAFKENITLSPVKPYQQSVASSRNVSPAMSGLHETNKRQSWMSDHTASRIPSAFGVNSAYSSHPAVRIAREHRSSPAYKGVHRGMPSAAGIPQAAQRWNSQPVLTNVTNNHNRHHSQHGEIRQTRLLSARQAPTPPLPVIPTSWDASRPSAWDTTPRASRGHSSSISSINRQSEDAFSRPSRLATSSPSPKSNPLAISAAETSAYWAGRLCALTDRFRNEELAAHLMARPSGDRSSDYLTPKGQTDKMHTPEASTARTKRALEMLAELCSTLEAKESLLDFQREYAKVVGEPELAPIRPARTIVLGSVADEHAGLGTNTGAGGVSEMRKTSFMDRLLGRQKRRSLVLQ